ncbi:Protein kinase C-binding protein 1, partial [Fasciola hepatica]
RVLGGAYASTQAFLGDFRWILHNCIIFNGASSPLTSCARLLDQACSRELALMRACPTCYLSRMQAVHVLPSTPKVLPLLTKQEWLRSVIPTTESPKIEKKVDEFKLSENSPIDPWWFCKLCDVVHPLVWVRLEYYPRWPAKVMAVDTHEILVIFFGDYDVTMAPLGSARVHSDSRTGSEGQTSSDQSFQCVSPLAGASCAASKGARNGPRSSSHLTVDASYKQALVELDYHMTQIKERYPTFKLPLSPVEFTQRYYAQFQKSYGPRSVKNTGKVTSSDGLTNENITTITETDSPATAVVSRKSQSVPPLKLISNADNLEPVLARAATGLLSPSSSRNAMDPVTSKIDAKPLDVNTCEQQQHSDTAQSSSSTAVVVLKMDVSEHPGSVEPRSQSEPKDDLDRPPTVLQPIPIIGRADDTESMDEIHVLLERMRTQFQQSLQCLEEKWHLAHANDERKHSLARDPPVLSAATVETEVQTDCEPTGKRSRKGHCEASSDVIPKVMDASTITKRVSSPLTPIQAVMMEGEIARLERENQRLNLLLAFTRAEMAFEMRHRIAELRRVWNFEVTAVLESASSIWEQDLIRIVDAVKRKQWCAYCGRVAFYYCCWNTCYCNSACQAKHWASHINSCVQARSQQALVEASTAAPAIGISTIPSPMASVSFDKVERSHHQSHQTMVAWPAAPVHSVTPVTAQTGGLACRTMSNTVRGKLNS